MNINKHTSAGIIKWTNLTVCLNELEAASLAVIVASGRAQDAAGKQLRLDLLHKIGEAVFRNPEWYLRLECATEHQGSGHEMGIVKLIRQAAAIPAIRVDADALLKQCAARLGHMIDQAGPHLATVKDMANRKGA